MISDSLGLRIKLARKAKGITQEQLAAALYVSRQTISNWENARSQPDYEMLQKLAELLDLNLAELFGTQPTSPEEASCGAVSAEQQEPAISPLPNIPSAVVSEPASPEVVQPSVKRRIAYRFIPVLVLAVFVGILLTARLSAGTSAYTMDWFAKGQTPVEGHAYVRIYAKVESVPLLPASTDTSAFWPMHLFFREEGGVGFQIEYLRFIYFFEDGKTQTVSYDKAYIGQELSSSHLNAYKMTQFSERFFLTPDTSAPLGVGCVIEGTDDTGHELAFGLYFPFEQP